MKYIYNNKMSHIEFRFRYADKEKNALIQRWKLVTKIRIKQILDCLGANRSFPTRLIKVLSEYGIELNRKDLRGFRFANLKLRKIHLEKYHLEHAIFYRCHFQKAFFSNSCLRYAFFLKCGLNNAVCNQTRFYMAIFDNCSLTNADMRHAGMDHVEFRNHCLLNYAYLQYAVISNASLNDAQFVGAKLFKTDFSGTSFKDVKIDIRTLKASKGVVYRACYIVPDSNMPDEVQNLLRQHIYVYRRDNEDYTVEPFRCFRSKNHSFCTLMPLKIPGMVFIGFPFSDKKILKAIKRVLARCWRTAWDALDFKDHADVICKICFNLQQSECAIVDISGNNPNVFFELGLCYGRNFNVILLKRSSTVRVCSDLNGQEYLEFSNNKQLENDLYEKLKVFRH